MKRGYTLLELIIVLGVISIICSVATISFRALKKIENNINRQTTIQEVEDMMSFARLYCASRKTTGRIIANTQTGEYQFILDSFKGTIKRNHVREGMEINSIDGSYDRWLTINANGVLYAGYIVLKDGYGKLIKISIRPGAFYDEIQEY